MISSEIWGKSARVYFERPIKLYEPVRTHMLRWFNSLIILFRGIAVYIMAVSGSQTFDQLIVLRWMLLFLAFALKL